jgi:PhnB protein
VFFVSSWLICLRSGDLKGKVKPIPEGFHTVTPRMFVRGAADAIEFYKQAFGATELGRFADPSGKIVNADIKIGDSIISMAEESPEWVTTARHLSAGRR